MKEKNEMLGICLLYQQKNYGSKLQALATIRMLEQLKLDYEILRYNKKTAKFILKYLLRVFNSVFLQDRYEQFQKAVELKKYPEMKAAIEIRNGLFESFDDYFTGSLSPYYSSYEELGKKCPQRYEKVLTCSDQLWSPSALGSGFYNLMFVPDHIRKISFASSFGVSNIPWYQVKRTREYLNRIEYISMRENRGAEIVKELTGRDVPVLLDPVFYFDKQEWETLIPPSAPEWDDYIFCYFLGANPEHRAAARKLAAQTGKKIVTLRHLDRYVPGDESFGDYAPYDVDPARFLDILRNAAYVCTDSFHGSAFSVLNEKKFVVFDRYDNRSVTSKNSRIDSLCVNLGLEDRRYDPNADIVAQMEKEIDYTAVGEAVACRREEMKNYLAQALAGA